MTASRTERMIMAVVLVAWFLGLSIYVRSQLPGTFELRTLAQRDEKIAELRKPVTGSDVLKFIDSNRYASSRTTDSAAFRKKLMAIGDRPYVEAHRDDELDR